MVRNVLEKVKSIIKDKKDFVVLILVILFALKVPVGGIRFVSWVLGGVFLCSLWDFLVNKLLFKKSIAPKSAIITGFILAGVLDYNQDWYVLLIFSIVAILSKFILRVNDKHVFNPANFALFIAVLFKQPLTWNIESNIYILIIVGTYLAVSLKKWTHVLGFILVFFGLFYFSGVNPLSMISWFFVFIMLIEPKTSGFGKLRGSMFGGIAGLTSFIMFKFIPQVDIFVTSLIIANIFNSVWGIKVKP